jgi:hypothetical protein
MRPVEFPCTSWVVREIAGLEVGSQLRAEGMVGEEEGSMVILNPSYELLV